MDIDIAGRLCLETEETGCRILLQKGKPGILLHPVVKCRTLRVRVLTLYQTTNFWTGPN